MLRRVDVAPFTLACPTISVPFTLAFPTQQHATRAQLERSAAAKPHPALSREW